VDTRSPDGRRLTDQGRERKQQLLDEAADLFSRRGYADTRVVDICEAAGVAKGLFYWYFENKEALFAELVTSMRLRLRLAQSDAMDPDADPLVRLRQGAEASLRFIAAHAPFFSLLEVENRDQAWTELLRAGTEVHAHDVAALIREGIELGLVRDDDPDLMAYGVVGVVSTYSHFQRTGRLAATPDEIAGTVGRFVVRSLAADDEIARRAEERPTPISAAGALG
jgi:AcrR family transcriptional regulator